MAQVQRILIVGGGIAGLSLATALRGSRMALEIVEQAPAWAPVGTGIFLQGNGVRALHDLCVADAVKDRGDVLRRHRMLAPDGDLLAEVDLEAMWSDVAPCVGVHRSVVHDALLAGAADVPLRLGTKPVSLEQTDDRVTVGFTDGTAAEYDLVVGCDGIRSSVRQLVFGGPAPTYADEVYWRFVVPAPPEVPAWTGFLGSDSLLGMFSIGEHQVYGFGQLYAPGSFDEALWSAPASFARFSSLFGALPEPAASIVAKLERPEQLYFSPAEEVVVDQWHQGRVLLIGDAAHATPPNMSEGAAMAMEDALVLAHELAADGPLEQAISRFMARRAPRVAWVKEQTRIRHRSSHAPPEIRNEMIRLHAARSARGNFEPLFEKP